MEVRAHVIDNSITTVYITCACTQYNFIIVHGIAIAYLVCRS